ncbi:molecular chaperone GrpE [Rubricella aquisinus]|uniref:Protein GrpE n=1 Tax=Rubricella aquisinus TaxID=2028108 RepID=A0A840WIX9_9RHOB|nr:nucleotide exchange factor GrpE [Rubricella aquisinus]MBB5514461.1 molecular chaperone GrpE [Rubricella aquisinus]
MAVNKDEEAPFLDDIDEIEEELEIEDEADDGELSFDDPKAGVDPADDMDAVIEERDALKDRLLRAFADLENTRKRAERDRRDAENYGGTKLARDLLPVYDNLARALAALTDEQREAAGPVIEGIELTQKELLSAFAKHKIARVSPEVGEKFDPKMHQAMFEAPLPGAEPGTVIQVMTDGFTIADRLIRPAQVGVASKG